MPKLVRPATQEDLDNIFLIINQARQYFRQNNIPQWTDGYPFRHTIQQDIEAGHSYVLEENGTITGIAALCYGIEKPYENICQGSWRAEGPYASIHRVAVDEAVKGTGSADFLLQSLVKTGFAAGVNSIRIDTHHSNPVMQHFLKKNGFEYRGLIYLEDGGERIAFDTLPM